MAPTRFNSLADTKTWEEANITIPTLSSETSTPSAVVSRVRTERVFKPDPKATHTFEGVGVAEYTLIYEHTPEEKPADPTLMKADYNGVLTLDGIFKIDGQKEIKGRLNALTEGRYDGAAKGTWTVVEKSVKGDLANYVKDGGVGGYVSKGMTDGESWLEFNLKA